MELRVLRYFLATAQELNMTRAAEKLLVSQPALSRQIAELEDELGVKLFIRRPRQLILTSAGQYLQEQAQEILTLTAKTKRNLQQSSLISGDLTIAAGESMAMQRIMNIIGQIIKNHPTVKFHILSGDYNFAEKRLNTGTVDFAVIMGNLPLRNYSALQLPEKNHWGVLMPADDPLAKKKEVQARDLVGRTLINSQQADRYQIFDHWFGNYRDKINIIGTYNLNFNGTLMVRNRTALMLCLDHLSCTQDAHLKFLPLSPGVSQSITVIWKKETNLSSVAQLFLDRLYASIKNK